MKNEIKRLKITGRVQGVGFRYFTRQNARDLNIKGWVKNLPDGSVETVLSGNPDDVNEMKNRLGRGPFRANVSGIEELDMDGAEADFSTFTIKR